MHKPSLKVALLCLWSVIIFILGNIFNPIITRVGENLRDKIIKDDEIIQVDACLPLKRSRMIARNLDSKPPAILSDQELRNVNNTMISIKNVSKRPLKEARILLYPLRPDYKDSETLFSSMSTSIIANAANFIVSKQNSGRMISVPQLNTEEQIFFNSYYDSPISMVIEILSDNYSYKNVFDSGCKEKEYILMHRPRVFYTEYSEECPKPANGTIFSCQLKPQSSIEISNDLFGKNISFETLVDQSP